MKTRSDHMKENLSIPRSSSQDPYTAKRTIQRIVSNSDLETTNSAFSSHSNMSSSRLNHHVHEEPMLQRSQSLNVDTFVSDFSSMNLGPNHNHSAPPLNPQPNPPPSQNPHQQWAQPGLFVSPQLGPTQYNMNFIGQQPYHSAPQSSGLPTPFQPGLTMQNLDLNFSPVPYYPMSPMTFNNGPSGLTPFFNAAASPMNAGFQTAIHNTPFQLPSAAGPNNFSYPANKPTTAIAMLERLRNVMKNHPQSSTSTRFTSNSNASQFRRQAAPRISQLYENAGITWNLGDIMDHIFEFSKDQYGSRFIQHKLQDPNVPRDQNHEVFERLSQYMSVLCKDVFGNYVVQKILEVDVGTVEEHNFIYNTCIKGNMYELSTHMYGCRVIQKLVEQVFGLTTNIYLQETEGRVEGSCLPRVDTHQGDVYDMEVQDSILHELKHDVTAMVTDQNGNHVIQKCIEQIRPIARLSFFFDKFKGRYADMSTHPYGCRVVQRVLENTDLGIVEGILQEIMMQVKVLIKDQYANYVVQHIVKHEFSAEDSGLSDPDEIAEILKKLNHYRSELFSTVSNNVLELSQHKFGSNVVECCLMNGPGKERFELIEKVVHKDTLVAMMKDPYANYVVQKVIDKASIPQLNRVVVLVQQNEQSLRKLMYGKHIINKLKSVRGINPLH